MPDDDDKITYLVPVPTHAPEAEVLDVEAPDTEAPEEVPKDEAVSAAEVSIPPHVAELVEVLIDSVKELAEEDDDEGTTIEVARLAWARIQTRTHQLWTDWLKIGLALDYGRDEALYTSQAKGPKGKKYSRAFNTWLSDNGFKDIHETARAFLLKIMDEYEAVEAWRGTLDPDERHKWNHPSTVWQHYNAWKRREGKRTPPKRSPIKASLENTIKEHDDAKVEIARLKRYIEEDQGPQMTKRDTPADQALCTYHWMPTLSAFGDYIRECEKLYKNPPRPSPLPKPPEPIGPRRHRALLPVDAEDETEEE